jgi:hypothetical protein
VKKKHLTAAAEIVHAGIDAVDPVEGPRMIPASEPIRSEGKTCRFNAFYRGHTVEVTVRPAPGPFPILAAGGPGGEAVRLAAERELTGSARWDEIKDLTVADLLSRNQDALIDDWYEDDLTPAQREEIAALVVTYDRLLGTRRAAGLG